MTTISILKKVSPKALQDLNGLMEELRGRKSRGSLTELKDLVGNKDASVVTANQGTHIVGVGILFIEQKIGERVAYIQDVIVSSKNQGQGLGTKIVKKLIAEARVKKAEKVGLTSRPSRVVANKLYQKLGFKKRETNVYALSLTR